MPSVDNIDLYAKVALITFAEDAVLYLTSEVYKKLAGLRKSAFEDENVKSSTLWHQPMEPYGFEKCWF
jgi:hypothetical protein